MLRDPRKSNDFNYHYIATHTRLPSYLVGFIAAYVASRLKEGKYVFSRVSTKSGKSKNSFSSPIFQVCLAIFQIQLRLGPLLLLVCSEAYQYYGVTFYAYGRKYVALEHAFYAATYRWIFVVPIGYLLCISFTSGIGKLFLKIDQHELSADMGGAFGYLPFSLGQNKFSEITKVVSVNVIVVILPTGGTAYRNSFKAHIFCSSRRIQRAFDHFSM